MRRALLILATLAILITSATAQTPLDAFHQALDAYEFEKAAVQAQKLPAGPARELTLAELDIATGRPDRSFARTDNLDPKAVPQDLLAKYYLIRARQEQATHYELKDDEDKATARMIREGLRVPANTHDPAALLLLKMELTTSQQQGVAQDALAELNDVPNLDSRISLQAQALLAAKAGKHKEAASIWSSLAETAGLKGQKRAQTVFKLQALEAQGTLDDKTPDAKQNAKQSTRQDARKQARDLLLQSAAAKDRTATLYSWRTLNKLSRREDNADTAAAGQLALAKLENSVEKLEILAAVAALLDKPAALEQLKQGAAIAHKLNEPVLEAALLDRQASSQSLYTKSEVLQRQAAKLLTPENVRGTSGLWFANVGWLVRRQPYTSVKTGATTDALQAAIATKSTPDQQLDLYDSYLRRALYDADVPLARATFFPALDLALSLPETDRARALNRLRPGIDPNAYWSTNAVPPDRRESWKHAVQRALAAELRSKPDLVERILDTNLLEIRRAEDHPSLAQAEMARWLSTLNRPSEAEELLRLAIANSSDPYPYQNALGAIMNNAEGWEILKAGLSRGSTDTQTPVQLGWLALAQGRAAEAESYAQQAIGQSPNSSNANAPHRLLAFAQARGGRTEEALTTLDQGTLLARREGSYSESPYLLTRADILLTAGRAEEAAISLRGVPISAPPRMSAYELRLRHDVAAKTDDKKALTMLEELSRAFLDRPASAPDQPIYAAELSRPISTNDNAAGTNNSPSTFADLVESLERLRRREPDNANLKRLSAADLRSLMDHAAGKEIYVQPILLQSSVVSIFITKEQAGVIEVFCDRPRLERAMLATTASLSSPNSSPTASDADRQYLAERLIAPWRARFPSKTQLRWIGDGPLQKLPLSALPDEKGQPLNSTLDVTYLDGPAYRSVKLDANAETLLVGGASDLAGSAGELEEVRRLFPRGESWTLGGDIGQLKALASRHRLLHISTHGQAPDAAKLGASLVGDGKELSSFDLSELSFAEGTVAVLGACESNIDAGTGHDNSSLVSALRTSGAAVVVGSLWQLDDAATRHLFAVFYQGLREGETAEVALSHAQTAVREEQAHPYFWAGVQVVSGP